VAPSSTSSPSCARPLARSNPLAFSRDLRRPLPRAERARLLRAIATPVTSPRVLCDAHHCAASQGTSTFCANVAVAARAVLALRRRRFIASLAPAPAARRLSAPLARPRHHRDITLRALRYPSPRRSPRARRPSAPTPPLPSAPSWLVDAACPVARSAPALATRRSSAPLARPRHHCDITLRALRCPPLAAAQERVDLPRRRRRCRSRCRAASTLLACCELDAGPCRAPIERASAFPVTTVTSTCVLCTANDRAAAQDRVDLLRRRRRRRSHRRGASTLVALL
jgi:hypothetical protein